MTNKPLYGVPMTAPEWRSWERNFIQQMALLRERRGMTQTDLAKRLKAFGLPFHQQTVQRVEAGERPVRLDEAHMIAHVLDADLSSMTIAADPGMREVRYAVDDLMRRSQGVVYNVDEDLGGFITEAINPLILVISDIVGSKDGSPPEDWAYDPKNGDSKMVVALNYLWRATDCFSALLEARQRFAVLGAGGIEDAVEIPDYPELVAARSWIASYVAAVAPQMEAWRDVQTLSQDDSAS